MKRPILACLILSLSAQAFGHGGTVSHLPRKRMRPLSFDTEPSSTSSALPLKPKDKVQDPSEKSVLRGLFACNKLLTAESDLDLSDKALQATLSQLFLVDFPLFTTARFNEVIMASTKVRIVRGEGGGTMSILDPKYLVFAEAISEASEQVWATLLRELVDAKDGIPTDQFYQLGFADTEQLKLILSKIESSPRLRGAMIQLLGNMFQEQLQAYRQEKNGKELISESKQGLKEKWRTFDMWPLGHFPIWPVFVAAPVGAVAAVALAPIPAAWDLVVLGGGFSVPFAWHAREIKNYLKGRWSLAMGGRKKKDFQKKLARFAVAEESALKVLEPAAVPSASPEPVVTENAYGTWSGTLKEGDTAGSRFRQLTPELPEFSFASIDRFGLGVREEAARLLVFNSALRDKFRKAEVWSEFFEKLRRVDDPKQFNVSSDGAELRSLSVTYARALNELQVQYDEGVAAFAAHLQFLSSEELQTRIAHEAAESNNPEAATRRILDALKRVEGRIKRSEAQMQAMHESLEAELRLTAQLEEQVGDLEQQAIQATTAVYRSEHAGAEAHWRFPEARDELLKTIESAFDFELGVSPRRKSELPNFLFIPPPPPPPKKSGGSDEGTVFRHTP